MSAIFPSSVATTLQLLQAINNTKVLLNVDAGIGDTTLTVDDASPLPTSGYLTFNDNESNPETVQYTGKSGNDLTGVTRGADSTAAGTHVADGTTALEMRWNAAYHNTLTAELIAVEQFLSDRFGLGTSPVVPSAKNLTLAATSNQLVIGTTRTVTITAPTPATSSRTWTIPDLSGDMTFAALGGTQTFSGSKTFSSTVTISATTNQIIFGTTNTTTINAAAPASSATYTIPDVGTTASFVMTAGAQTINGQKTYGSAPIFSALNATTVPYLDGSKVLTSSAVTPTELGYLSGATSSIQTQINSLGNVGSFKNRIINGEMLFDQVNEGASTTVNSNGGFRLIDMTIANGPTSAGAFTAQRLTSTPPTGFLYYMHVACSTADSSPASGTKYYFAYRVEGANIRDFNMGTANAVQMTLSFWVRSSLTGTYTGAIQNGNTDRAYTYEYTINSANTWEKKTITLTGDTTGTWPTDNSFAMQVVWIFAAGSSQVTAAGSWTSGAFWGTSNQVNFMSSNSSRTWDISGVQLELGASATGFEHRSYGTELSLCQRYYEKSYVIGTAPATNTTTNLQQFISSVVGASEVWGSTHTFKVEKRAAPSMTLYNSNGTSGSISRTSTSGSSASEAVDAQSVSMKGFGVHSSASAKPYSEGHFTADARL
jgi:hypothetical protein